LRERSLNPSKHQGSVLLRGIWFGSCSGQCDMASLSPVCEARLESCKLLHDMEPGDALIHTRCVCAARPSSHSPMCNPSLATIQCADCFHRGEPFTVEAAAAGASTRLAYSIRYEAADAKLVNNNFESALKAKRLKGGEPISAAGPYYPQVWPRSRPLERLIVRLGRLSPDPF